MNEPPKVDLSKSRSCVSCVRVKPLSMDSSMLSDFVRGLLDAFGIVTEVVEVIRWSEPRPTYPVHVSD